MSRNFDWQTEEDERKPQNIWDEPAEPDPPGSTGRKPPWRLIAVVAVLLVMVGGIVWWRVDKRIDATLEAFRIDVIASHNLIQRAVDDGDEEIFRSGLSGRVPSWTSAELEVFRRQLFVDRAPLGLMPVEGSLPAILPTTNEEAADELPADITFSPDLNEAIVTINQPYLREGTNETVTLRQTTVFRRGDRRWLLAPPLDEFWGEWVTSEGDYLDLIYPARDRLVAERLAADLDAEIGRMCATLEDIDCSADLHLTVRFDTDPAALASLARPLGALRRAREREDILELPTPTLAGLPVEGDEAQSEAGYAALRDGYARQLLGAVTAQVVGWRCCDEDLLFETLTEYQLGQLGLFHWPVNADDYARVGELGVRLSDLGVFLRSRFPTEVPEDRLWEVRTAVDFLANGLPGVSVAETQRATQRTRNFDQFLNAVKALSDASDERIVLPNDLDLAWWLYAFAGTLVPSAAPIADADEDLYLSCTAVDGNQASDRSLLLQYSPEEEQWNQLYSVQGFLWMSALPDPGTLLMQEFALEQEIWRTNVWRDGGLLRAYVPPDDNYALSFGETDPSGQGLVTYAYSPDAGLIRGFLVDLADCEGDCATSELPGRPFWSPDGQWAVYLGGTTSFPDNSLLISNNRYVIIDSEQGLRDSSLTLGPGDAAPDSPELTPIGVGRAPFWINNDTFGYLRQSDSAALPGRVEDEIVIASIDQSAPRTIIRAADLYQFLPERVFQDRLSLAYVATHPGQPNRLFVVALDPLESRAYVILYDLDTRLPEVRMNLLYNVSHSLGFSPDGRFLVLTGQDRASTSPNDNSAVLLVHDIAANRTYPFITRLPFFLPSVVFDWTEDSRWLAMAGEDNLVTLVAPDAGYARLIPHGYGTCTSVAWLQP